MQTLPSSEENIPVLSTLLPAQIQKNSGAATVKKMNSIPAKASMFLFCASKHKEPLCPISRKGLISCMTVDKNAKICFVVTWYINILEAQSKKEN